MSTLGRMFLSVARSAWIAILALVGPTMVSIALADDPQPAPTYYWHLWTDDHGVTHQTKCTFSNFTFGTLNASTEAHWQNKQALSASQMIVTVFPANWVGVWRESPKVQWVIPTIGTWYVETMDGQRVEMGPGDIMLSEDQNSKDEKGHLAGAVSSGPLTQLIIPLDVAPTRNQPCRVK